MATLANAKHVRSDCRLAFLLVAAGHRNMKPLHLRIVGMIAALSLSFPECKATDANVLKGTGYVDLKGDTSAPLPTAAAGPRFVWVPDFEGDSRVGAIFIGHAQTSQTFENSVSLLGQASYYGTAVGPGSFAGSAVALGSRSTALGYTSIAIGTKIEGDNWDYGATAIAQGSTAIGPWSESQAPWSTAFGFHSTSSGDYSTALGAWISTVGDRSTALGYSTVAIGDDSVALGSSLYATALRSVALGTYNIGDKRKDLTTVNPLVADSRDSLVTVGKGYAYNQRSNALTIYRDGDAHFAGSIRMKPAGDISMGSFTAGPSREP